MSWYVGFRGVERAPDGAEELMRSSSPDGAGGLGDDAELCVLLLDDKATADKGCAEPALRTVGKLLAGGAASGNGRSSSLAQRAGLASLRRTM